MSKVSNATQTLKLNTGQIISAVGLGTWQSTSQEVYDAVIAALNVGYRHIDTAAAYGNEEIIGKAIKDSKIPREEIFVTTKLWCTDHTRPQEALDASLEKLGLDYVDLYLMHWPVPLNPASGEKFPKLPNGKRDILTNWDFVKTYELLQELVPTGKTKAIGVSNFTVKNLTKLCTSPTIKIKPAANQVEMHPYLPQPKLLQFCKDNGIVVEAYSPLGSTDSPILKDETVAKVAEKYGVSPATILISWAIWRGVVVLPKSVTPSRVESNFMVVELSDEDGEVLDKISEKGIRRIVDPDWSPVVVFDSSD